MPEFLSGDHDGGQKPFLMFWEPGDVAHDQLAISRTGAGHRYPHVLARARRLFTDLTWHVALPGAAACLCVIGTTAVARPLGPRVILPAGPVETVARDQTGILAFKGIPYAAPPVGHLRWQAPQSVRHWSKPLNTSRFGPACLTTGATPNASRDEDCLTLNVWTSARTSAAGLPVMVWIPGGGFQTSASSRINADGAKFAAKGVVVVSFNYRVGVYGFLAHPGLDRPGEASGDFGLADQLAALKWVKQNIQKFGGDPRNVTIAGESAGGASVALLMASPLARGLFQKAICESHGFWESIHGSIQTHAEALAKGRGLADRLAGGSIEALRALPASRIGEATKAAVGRSDSVSEGFSPNVDGRIVPYAPAAIFARGRQARVPLLVGYNASEGASFALFARPIATAALYRDALRKWLGDASFERAFNLYPAHADSEVGAALEQLFGDVASKQQTWELMQLHSDTSGVAVFSYVFDMHSNYTPSPAHTAEIDYVFGTLQPHWLAPTGGAPGADDAALSGLMMAYWSNFVRSGDPNGAGLPAWPRYRSADPKVMVLDAHPEVRAEDSERLRFLRSFRKDGRMPASWRSTAADLAY